MADDYGKLRAQFYLFEKPYYALKGSYLVSRVGTYCAFVKIISAIVVKLTNRN